MAKTLALPLLRTLMVLILVGWLSLWVLKPTEFWTRKWHTAEDSTRSTILRYNGLNFVVYTFPVIALAVVGYVCLHLQPRASRRRKPRRSALLLSNPVIVKTPLGILSGFEVLAMLGFIMLLAWTFYARISGDYKKLIPVKSLKLKIWQLKFLRTATRFGLLAEACLAFLLLPILRGMSVLRVLGIQFEASVRYHIWLGTLMTFFATLHGMGTLFIWGISNRIQDEVWKWQKEGRIYLAGEITLFTGLIIWISSLPFVRRRRFNIFYNMHHLYFVFLAFFLFHAGDRHFYMVLSGVFLFGLDKLLRIIQSWAQTCILSAKVYPCRTIQISVPKHPRLKYTPTSIIFIKIPAISRLEWHPFSITSSSAVDEEKMSVMVKCEGQWTNALYDILQQERDSPGSRKCIPVAIEGPYGPASIDFITRYESLLLIGGGIGVTPFLSILQEITSPKITHTQNKFPSEIQLIYAMKKCQDISILNPISSLIINSQSLHLKLKIFITQEHKGRSSVIELLHEFSEVQTLLFDTNNSNYVFGPINPLLMAGLSGFSSVVFLVFLCIFNHFQQSSKPKGTPSSVDDLFLLCALLIGLASSVIVVVLLRRRRQNHGVQLTRQIEGAETEIGSVQGDGIVDEHEIYYGGRPDFPDLISKSQRELGESNVGVVVCGPESMKDAVALAFQQKCQVLQKSAAKKHQLFGFHSLNFTL